MSQIPTVLLQAVLLAPMKSNLVYIIELRFPPPLFVIAIHSPQFQCEQLLSIEEDVFLPVPLLY